MKNKFIDNSTLGKNNWWRYVLSITVPVIVIALINILVRQILPSLKSLFPDDDFGEELGTYSLLFLVFGLALFAFMVAASKLHKRAIMSFISTDNNFSWKHYFLGFVLWGGLLFLVSVITDFQSFEAFLQSFNSAQFAVLLAASFVSIGIQSFFEEIVIRGYWLQGLHLRIKTISSLVLVNGLIFGLLHFGYGIESFLSSWAFGIAFAIIVILQNRIEFVSGAHNANNLLLSLMFLDLSEATNQNFSWSINWTEFLLHIFTLLLLVGLVIKFFSDRTINNCTRPKNKSLGFKALIMFGVIFLCTEHSLSQTTQLSDNWINKNVHALPLDSGSVNKFDFLKNEIPDKRIIFLGEATHYDGGTFAVRSEMIEFLIKEMDYTVILFEAGMFDLMQANNEFQESRQAEAIKKSLWKFWQSKQWEPFFSFIEQYKNSATSIQIAGFDCKFSSSYGFDNNNYSKFIIELFHKKNPSVLNHENFNAYIKVWQNIEQGYQKKGMRGGLAKIRYKMSSEQKKNLRSLSQWIVEQLQEIDEPTVAQMVKSNDESIIAYSDLRMMKIIFNKKSIIPINNRRDELMAENLIYLLKNVYPDKKVIVVGGTYHFIRNNSLIEPVKIQGIPIHESIIAGNLIYNTFANEIYSIGFTAFEGKYGLVSADKKGSSVKSPQVNSLEFQLAERGIQEAFVTLDQSLNEPFFSKGASLRLFDHESEAISKNWKDIIDAVFFIKNMTPAKL